MQLVDQYFDRTGLVWKNVISVCTDGAPAMLGSRSGFVQLARKENPDIESVHCFIHREALASRTLPQAMKSNLVTNIKIVNYIKASALNTRLFSALCHESDAAFTTLLFHTEETVAACLKRRSEFTTTVTWNMVSHT
ncbi:hypothetical protein EB796_008439 [Bugula neritina]|uniref:ZBED5 n=1 Tax=Bugula neritina TaxID=10212 RepID=A0A7J7K3Q5_BUGNE|nr:hypothetical protein EB796_008439 [Bugula neritina]